MGLFDIFKSKTQSTTNIDFFYESDQYQKYIKESQPSSDKYFNGMQHLESNWSVLYNLDDYLGDFAIKYESDSLKYITPTNNELNLYNITKWNINILESGGEYDLTFNITCGDDNDKAMLQKKEFSVNFVIELKYKDAFNLNEYAMKTQMEVLVKNKNVAQKNYQNYGT